MYQSEHNIHFPNPSDPKVGWFSTLSRTLWVYTRSSESAYMKGVLEKDLVVYHKTSHHLIGEVVLLCGKLR